MTDLPIEHVERPSLPWRESSRTECGLPVAGHPVITRDAFMAKVRAQGRQRAAFTTCMTCWSTTERWPTFEQNPVECIERETYNGRRRGQDQFRDELVALAELVSRHREEFDATLAGLSDTARLDERRAARAWRRATS